ncbi:uncharacterized protein LY89DRAFT_717199 [Mollisia scopiformis]|uniref:Uncharacterized protein n=1 Tax=Mollisia scopiformis TaxID=149040 RepID=A0A194XEP1_MOLSC|nr:uncharacterized protein LY89DRAFT_717199 [Mollisia scopiformis]KUJ18616.1 hypothetical protein LY89DRAFT_717199 [Mollisia scopiformis]
MGHNGVAVNDVAKVKRGVSTVIYTVQTTGTFYYDGTYTLITAAPTNFEVSETTATNSLSSTTASSTSSSSTTSFSSASLSSTSSSPLSSISVARSRPSHSSTSSSGISAGETAGISIGTFIAGLALALLGFWFCMNRRKHSQGHRSRKSHDNNTYDGDKQGISQTSTREETLLDPVDDSTLKSTMAKLNSFIDQHVLSHYHEDPIQISQRQLAQAIIDRRSKNALGDMSPDELASLMIAPATRLHAIRHFVAWVILSHTGLDAQPDACLLPRYIVTFYNAFPPIERQAGCEEAFECALSQWKHLSAFLLVPNRSFREDPKVDETQVRSAIDVNLKAFNHVLAPFVINGPVNNHDWEKNLRAIVFAGAELGLTLFSQQSAWVFDWKHHGRSEAVVVFPALLEKVKGRSKLRIVSEAVMA